MLFGDIHQLTQNSLMTKMNAIKGADSCHTASVPGAQVVQPTNKRLCHWIHAVYYPQPKYLKMSTRKMKAGSIQERRRLSLPRPHR